MKKSNNGLIIAAASGAAVYFFFPQVKEFLVGGEYSGAGAGGVAEQTTSGQIVDDALTKKQLSFISSELDSSNDISVSTNSVNDYSRATVTSSLSNASIIESVKGFANFAGTDTTFLYKDSSGSIVGGSDFGLNMSLSKKAAKAAEETKTNPLVTIARKTSRSSSSSSSSKKSISTSKDPVVSDYENKNLVSTTKTATEIKKENKIKSLFFGGN